MLPGKALGIWQTPLEQGNKKSKGFTTFNFVFLGAISFIPFPTSLISEHSEQPLSVIIFSATYVVAGLALAGMWLSEERQSAASGTRSDVSHAVRRIIILMPVTAIIA
ncbi:MAG: hypothetical protein IMF02_14655 [Proteobacteria bacterium]|jgi:uncharacterized membrane protein|nr:hypothetical protein [Pseudomonadota bacterium]